MKNDKGFTLIELLAVIVIMGILMAIAIPSINLIIMDARKDIYVNSARTFINEAEKEVINSTFEIDDPDTTYYIHIANLVDDVTNLGKSGFATWSDSYVVATMALVNNKVDTKYYFNSVDLAGWKITLIGRDKLKKSDVYQDSRKTVDFMPVGNRKKIVLYDANGTKVTNIKPIVSLSKEKAEQCYTYTETETEVTLKEYKPICGSDVIVPGAIAGKRVTEIGDRSFYNKGITNVYVPYTVKTIGQLAFMQNKLTSITLSEGLKTISYAAFYVNNLTEVSVPSSVEIIGTMGFSRNSISKLSLPKNLKSIGNEGFRYNELTEAIEVLVPGPSTTIGDKAFYDNKIAVNDLFWYKKKSDGSPDYTILLGYLGEYTKFSDNKFVIPGSKKGVALKEINDRAFFSQKSLKDWTVVIPDSVTRIGQLSFMNTGISSVKLPSSLKTVEYAAFYNNNITEVVVPNGAETLGLVAFSRNKIKKISLPKSLKSIGNECFRYNELTDSIETMVPSKKTTIGTKAFADNKILAENTFTYMRNDDDSVDYSIITGYIGDYEEFSDKKFVIPGSKNGVALKEISERAFFNYSSLKGWSVVIPNTVTTIRQLAFMNTGIVAVTLPSNLKIVEYAAFYNNSLEEVKFPNSTETLGTVAFSRNKIKKISLPKTLKSIGNECFRYNELTDSIETMVPGKDTTIGTQVFADNKILPENSFTYKRNDDGTIDYSTITGYIGNYKEFSNNTFVIPGSKNGVALKTITDRAFFNYTSLKGWNLVIPDSVTTIKQLAFMETGIVSVKLPSNLKTVEYAAFYNNGITEVVVPSSTETLGTVVFSRNKIKKISLPKTLKSIGNECFRYNELTDSIETMVPGKDTTIGTQAFANNKILPENSFTYKRNDDGTIDYSTITGYIGDYSEFGSSEFVILGSKNGVALKNIKDRIFLNNTNLKGRRLVIPDTVTTIGDLAFMSTGITSVKLPSSLKTVGYAVFYNNSITEVTVPSNIETIGLIAFSKNKISKVTLNEGLKSLGNEAFRYNELTTVTIPSTVTSIGTNAFTNNSLKTIVNKTGKKFNWKDIVNGTSAANFETGTIKTSNGNITVTN